MPGSGTAVAEEVMSSITEASNPLFFVAPALTIKYSDAMLHVLRKHLFLLAVVLGFSANSQTYLGANAALRRVEELNAKPGATNENADPQSKLRADLKAFELAVTNYPPDQAAKGWLELGDRSAKIQSQPGRMFNPAAMPVQADELLGALPTPADWKELASAIAARPAAKGRAEMPETGLRFLAASLTGDADGRKREIATLQAKAKDSDPQTMMVYRGILQQLSQAILSMSDDPDAILMTLERQLDSTQERGFPMPITVPNLVSQVGPEKAEAFLRKALVRPSISLQFQTPNETSRLGQKLALELMDQLKTPQWGLVNSLDAVDLYEALEKHFAAVTNKSVALPGLPDVDLPPEESDMMGQKPQAQAWYFLGLISKDRPKDAVAVAKKLGGGRRVYLPPEAIKGMERAGYTAALDNFFYELLSQDSALPFWDEYVQLAAKAGTTDRMLKLARAAAASQDLSDNKKEGIHRVLFKALLAADAVDEGVEEIRRLIALEPSAPQQFSGDESHGQLGITLAQIGVLLQKPEWTEEGIAAAKKWLQQGTGEPEFAFETGPVVDSLEEILFKLNRGPEAELSLTEALARSTRETKGREAMYYGASGTPQILTAMTVLYDQAGRSADVLALLEQSPNWGAADLSGLFETSMMPEFGLMQLHTGSSTPPVPYLAAKALLAAGRKEEAGKITDELLNRKPGLDRGYELLLELKGPEAISRLDELFAGDQFEERPLIWKAHLLRQQNKLAEAETIIRQAIAIDPSDGEEGRGDRMRAYSELADIREARGDKKEADFYREVVKAIRLSEDADQFYKAGLLKRAIPMYEEGLNHFADAYCIQSRLAIQLAGLGKNQEAEEHYRRAYELMPDSFGRVESHCFGCERVFDGERAQGIAEKAFTKMVAERPDKPQVHYLLGYLREEQERYHEACTNYLAAARLDSNYLNAWIKVQGISEHVLMPPKQRDEIAFNILRLDPLQRHGRARFDGVSDLPGLWSAVAAAAARQPAPATNLFTLTASKAALEKKKDKPDEQMGFNMQEAMQAEGAALSPGRALAQTPFVRLAGQLIANGSFSMGEE